MLSIRVSNDIEKRLEHLAKETGRTKSFYVKKALMEYLEDMEDIYRRDKIW
jgi:RHH-type rel operon transcriptional repressor/antitoxin RelB